MKEKNCKLAKDEKIIEIEQSVQEPKNWVVNCPKCGAALDLKSGGTAYLCPVCGTLLSVKVKARLVKQLKLPEKTLHINVSEQAIQYLVKREIIEQKRKQKRCLFKRRNRAPIFNLENMLARKIIADGYKLDADELAKKEYFTQRNKCCLSKSKMPTFEDVLARQIMEQGYSAEDIILVDVDEKGLKIKKSEIKVEETV